MWLNVTFNYNVIVKNMDNIKTYLIKHKDELK